MMGWFSRKNKPEVTASAEGEKVSFWQGLVQVLSKTRAALGEGLSSLILGRKAFDEDFFEELESLLIRSDLGLTFSGELIRDLKDKLNRSELKDPAAVLTHLRAALQQVLEQVETPWALSSAKPAVILMVGVNGAGKTTTLGKLAHYFKKHGKSMVLAAGDTFRAAAVEQLQVWGVRNQVSVIAQAQGESAAVIFDAFQAAKARGMDLVLADTAGRLQNKSHLMEELKKVARVLKKLDPEAPHEVFLVIDATTGQNAIQQAEVFHQAVPLTGLILTKLDGSSKGGVAFAIAHRLKIPIRFIGVGEGLEDLKPFVAQEFVNALFDSVERQ